jgi:MFS family permease
MQRRFPRWYRTPRTQTLVLGLVFFQVFTAYTTIQFYASSNYGPELASRIVSTLYVTFTIGCLVAPTWTNQWGAPAAVTFGILGYAVLVMTSLLYFQFPQHAGVVIGGGAVLGFGASLLWTGQGRLLLAYAQNDATLLGLFWSVFQCSAVTGGLLSFLYYGRETNANNAGLYLIFLGFILMGALASHFLLIPPRELYRLPKQEESVDSMEETTSLVVNQSNYRNNEESSEDFSQHSWWYETRETLRMFSSSTMLWLGPLFFYTGFNQPYQQATFGNRMVSKRTIGLELIVFHSMEILGGFVGGKLLKSRTTALYCWALFGIMIIFGNALALFVELHPSVAAVDVADGWAVLLPSLAFVSWGLADAQINLYIMWLLGHWYADSERSRAIGFYKCLQSLGYSLGFWCMPTSRMSALHQWILSSSLFVVGSVMSLRKLPKRSTSG